MISVRPDGTMGIAFCNPQQDDQAVADTIVMLVPGSNCISTSLTIVATNTFETSSIDYLTTIREIMFSTR